MINHGGLGTIKECIYFGVPMIVFPMMRDQPGNAARVAYHGLGIVGQSRVSAGQVNALIDTVERNPSFRARAEAMGKKFREIEDSGIGIQVIERLVHWHADT